MAAIKHQASSALEKPDLLVLLLLAELWRPGKGPLHDMNQVGSWSCSADADPQDTVCGRTSAGREEESAQETAGSPREQTNGQTTVDIVGPGQSAGYTDRWPKISAKHPPQFAEAGSRETLAVMSRLLRKVQKYDATQILVESYWIYPRVSIKSMGRVLR